MTTSQSCGCRKRVLGGPPGHAYTDRLPSDAWAPHMTSSIPISRVELGPDVEALVLEVLRSGQLAQGPMVERLENAFREVTGTEHAVAVCNGTVALVAALQAVGIGPGDEIITSPFTFIATINAFSRPARECASPISASTTTTSIPTRSPPPSRRRRARSFPYISTATRPTAPRSRCSPNATGSRWSKTPRKPSARATATWSSDHSASAVSACTRRRTSRPVRAEWSPPTTARSPTAYASCAIKECGRATSTKWRVTTTASPISKPRSGSRRWNDSRSRPANAKRTPRS